MAELGRGHEWPVECQCFLVHRWRLVYIFLLLLFISDLYETP